MRSMIGQMHEGNLLVTPDQFQRLRDEYTPKDKGVYDQAWLSGIPVIVVPDDGTPVKVGGGKVAVHSKFDPEHFILMDEKLLDGIVLPAERGLKLLEDRTGWRRQIGYEYLATHRWPNNPLGLLPGETRHLATYQQARKPKAKSLLHRLGAWLLRR